jgi:hypothetical protein
MNRPITGESPSRIILTEPAVVSPTGQSLARLIEQARSPQGAPVCVWPWAIPPLSFVTPLCQFLLQHDDFLQGVRMVLPLELQLAFQVSVALFEPGYVLLPNFNYDNALCDLSRISRAHSVGC